MAEADIGMAGLGVMGLNLALNMERNGHTVAIWNREPAAVDKFMAGEGSGKREMDSFRRPTSSLLRAICGTGRNSGSVPVRERRGLARNRR